MEKVEVVNVEDAGPLSQLGKWKKEIRSFVADFHRQGLVHGDLRLANFIFTKTIPCKMLLIGFDRGGKAGRVHFPPGQLCKELQVMQVEDDHLDRLITVGHDDEVLKRTFKRLDELADQNPGIEMEVDGGLSGWHVETVV